MRIEGYGLNTTPPGAPAKRPAGTSATPPAATFAQAEATAGEGISAQDKLRMMIEEKQWMAQAAFEGATPESELGKHIDLRV
jgi:hypothetical protein